MTWRTRFLILFALIPVLACNNQLAQQTDLALTIRPKNPGFGSTQPDHALELIQNGSTFRFTAKAETIYKLHLSGADSAPKVEVLADKGAATLEQRHKHTAEAKSGKSVVYHHFFFFEATAAGTARLSIKPGDASGMKGPAKLSVSVYESDDDEAESIAEILEEQNEKKAAGAAKPASDSSSVEEEEKEEEGDEDGEESEEE
ncbi:MAG: hypothetical protein A2284_17095 [Deltaproteobacteria bacterium RIFOXYA12_FULL_61_11]|nr:MAG: hypothetical protein A2284_17095 [Deltaproteobacteria bacterium RIFOXYA12_FULL_61_11]